MCVIHLLNLLGKKCYLRPLANVKWNWNTTETKLKQICFISADHRRHCFVCFVSAPRTRETKRWNNHRRRGLKQLWNKSKRFHSCFSVLLPAPGRGTGYCFRAISFFVSMSARLRENGWTDLHEIFREGVEWPWDDLIKFWAIRVNGSAGQRSICLLSRAIAQRPGLNNSVSFARWQQGAGFVVPRTIACF